MTCLFGVCNIDMLYEMTHWSGIMPKHYMNQLKVSLCCGHNVEPLCEKGYRQIYHPLATLNNLKSRERGWYRVWEKRREDKQSWGTHMKSW